MSEQTPKFKKGDRIMVTGRVWACSIGDLGTVVSHDGWQPNPFKNNQLEERITVFVDHLGSEMGNEAATWELYNEDGLNYGDVVIALHGIYEEDMGKLQPEAYNLRRHKLIIPKNRKGIVTGFRANPEPYVLVEFKAGNGNDGAIAHPVLNEWISLVGE